MNKGAGGKGNKSLNNFNSKTEDFQQNYILFLYAVTWK